MASNSHSLASAQTRENFVTVCNHMKEMFQKQGFEDPEGKIKLCIRSAHNKIMKRLFQMDHGVDWLGRPKAVSAEYYMEQMMEQMWRGCCELCRIPNNERAPLPVAVALTKAHMYGSPPAPEHVKRIEEHEAQKKVLDPETRIEQTPLVVPPPPSQPEGADSESVQPSREDEHGNCVLGHVEAMDNRGGQVREHTTDEATDKKPVYYREWFNGQTDTECKFSIDDDEADINRMWELWEEYFGRQGIRPNTKYPFELCIPANKSRLFFGAQGSAIKQIMALCLTPIRICTRYDSEWLYVGLWFRKMARSPRMPLLQMYSILHHWSITLDQGLFFDVKLGQEIEQRARVLAGQVGDSMWRQRSSTTVRESTIVGDEDECADREME